MLDKNDMITFQGIADSSISISGSDRWTMVLYMLNKNGDYVYLDVDDDYRLYKSTGIVITYKLVFSNGETLTSKSCIIGTASDLNPSLSEYAYIHKMENFYISGNNQLGAIVDTQYRFNIPPRLAGYSFKCKADISFIEGDYAFSKGSSSASSGYSNYYLEIVRSPTTQTNMRMTSNIYRSNAHFNLNDLWNNEYNVFDEILKYCKIFNLIVQVNDKDKTI
jgi:hypothetical protein